MQGRHLAQLLQVSAYAFIEKHYAMRSTKVEGLEKLGVVKHSAARRSANC